MGFNLVDPITDYNTANSTSYVAITSLSLYVHTAGEIWCALQTTAVEDTPPWMRIDESTGEAIGPVDAPADAVGKFSIGDATRFYAADGLVIATASDNWGSTPNRRALVAWNLDGTIAWETYWEDWTEQIGYLCVNDTASAGLYCYMATSFPGNLQSINASTGARTTLRSNWYTAYGDFHVDNDGNVWNSWHQTGQNLKIQRYNPNTDTLDEIHDFQSGDLFRWMGYDPTNHKVLYVYDNWPTYYVIEYDCGADTESSPVVVEGYAADAVNTTAYNAPTASFFGYQWSTSVGILLSPSGLTLDSIVGETFRADLGYLYERVIAAASANRTWWRVYEGGLWKYVIWDRCTGEMSLFIGCESEPLISRVRISDLTYRDKADSGTGSFSEDPEGFGFVGCVRIGKYGYFVQESSTDNKDGMWMFKVDLTTNSQVGALFLDNPRTSVWPYAYSACADTSNENIYILYSSYNASGGGGDVVIFKVRVSDFSVLATLDLSATYSNYSSAYWLNDLFVCSDDYLFVHVTESSPSPYQPTLLRIDLSSFTLDATVSTSGGWSGSSWTTGYNELNCGLLGSDGYIYCGATDNAATTERAVVLKIDPWTPSIESALAIRSDTTTSAAIVTSLTTDGTYLYATDSGFGVPSSDPKIAKIFIYEFTLDASATLTNDNYPVPKEAVMVDGSIYLIGYQAPRDGGSTGVLRAWEVKASDLTVVREVDLALTRNQYVSQRPLLYCFSAAVEAIRRWVTININMRRRF